MGRSSNRKHERASKQNGTYRVAATPRLSGPVTLTTFKDIVALAEHCIYLIARVRQNPGSNPPTFSVRALGTGFIAAPHRMVTAAHVLDNPAPDTHDLANDQPVCAYIPIRRPQTYSSSCPNTN